MPVVQLVHSVLLIMYAVPLKCICPCQQAPLSTSDQTIFSLLQIRVQMILYTFWLVGAGIAQAALPS